MSYRILLLYLIVIIFPSVVLWADDKSDMLNQQKELDRIKKEITTSHNKLNQLKQNEMEVQKQLSETDQKIRTDHTVINRLNRQLKQVQKTIENTESDIRDKELFFDLTRRRYLGNIRHFYKSAINPTVLIVKDANDELILDRQIKYLGALAHYESDNVVVASELLEKTIADKDKLSGEQKEMSRLKRNKETSKALAASQKDKQEKDLKGIRRKQTDETDRIMMLEQAAQEMEKIIVRLQQEAEERLHTARQSGATTSFFASLKGQLTPPYQGRIKTAFGNIVDPITNLKSFSSGISIQGQAGRKVIAVSSGTVAYVGNLRGYGSFIIINHDDRFFTTYAGLGATDVSTNEYVLAGNKIAESDENGLVKFELRDGRKPLDPVEWIRFDSFR